MEQTYFLCTTVNDICKHLENVDPNNLSTPAKITCIMLQNKLLKTLCNMPTEVDEQIKLQKELKQLHILYNSRIQPQIAKKNGSEISACNETIKYTKEELQIILKEDVSNYVKYIDGHWTWTSKDYALKYQPKMSKTVQREFKPQTSQRIFTLKKIVGNDYDTLMEQRRMFNNGTPWISVKHVKE